MKRIGATWFLLVAAGVGYAEPQIPARQITAAEIQQAAWRRDNALPKLWQDDNGAPTELYQRVARYLDLEPSVIVWNTSNLQTDPPQDPQQDPEPGTPDAAAPTSPADYPVWTLTVDESVEIALQNNYLLQSRELLRDSAEQRVHENRAQYAPTFGILASRLEQTNVRNGILDLPESETAFVPFVRQLLPTGATLTLSGNLIEQTVEDDTEQKPSVSTGSRIFDADARLTLVQPLMRNGWGVVTNRPINDAKSDALIADSFYDTRTLEVVVLAKTAYYEVALFENLVRVTQEAIERDRALVEASAALFEGGLVTKRDVYSANIQLAEDEAALAVNQADLELARNEFLNVLGVPIDTEFALADTSLEYTPVRLEEDLWIAIAVDNRPEIAGLEESLVKQQREIRVSKNGVLPQLDLVATYRRAETATTQDAAFDLGGDSWFASLNFTIPIGNVAPESRLKQAKLNVGAVERELEDAKRIVELQVRAAVIKLTSSLDRMRTRRVGVEQSRGKLEIAKERFVLGLATNLDITDAQKELLDAQTDLLAAMADYNIGVAELEASVALPPGDDLATVQ